MLAAQDCQAHDEVGNYNDSEENAVYENSDDNNNDDNDNYILPRSFRLLRRGDFAWDAFIVKHFDGEVEATPPHCDDDEEDASFHSSDAWSQRGWDTESESFHSSDAWSRREDEHAYDSDCHRLAPGNPAQHCHSVFIARSFELSPDFGHHSSFVRLCPTTDDVGWRSYTHVHCSHESMCLQTGCLQ